MRISELWALLLLPGAVLAAGSAPGCLARLESTALDRQLVCLDGLRPPRVQPEAILPRLESLLARSTGKTDQRLIVGALDALRRFGSGAGGASDSVSALLSYRAPVYQDRDKQLAARLRGYLFVTLADIGVPRSAEPALLDALAHPDERLVPFELGAAARAVGTLGARGHPFSNYLLSVVSTRISEEEFSLEHFSPLFPAAEATTLQIEALRALGKLGNRDDGVILEALELFAGRPAESGADPRAQREAARARDLIAARKPETPGDFVAPDLWIAAADRVGRPRLDVPVTDQGGTPRALGQLLDRPTLVAFFYTRCQNDSKCSMTMSHLAFLQRQLVREGLAGDVRLLAITYEPQFDTPDRLSRFATDRGLVPGENALVLRVEPDSQQQVIDELLVPVSYNAAWVSAHGVEASLLDARGRLVRKYSTVRWNNDALVTDFRRVLAESTPRGGMRTAPRPGN